MHYIAQTLQVTFVLQVTLHICDFKTSILMQANQERRREREREREGVDYRMKEYSSIPCWLPQRGQYLYNITYKKEEQSERADLGQGSSLPHIARIPNMETQHGDPDHTKNSINCSLYLCWAILKFSSKCTYNFFSNGQISDWTVSMVIWIAIKL